jgi:hypothetical protein
VAATNRRDTADLEVPELEAAIASARVHRAELLALPHVVAVRSGYKFVGRRITGTPAVVVAVDRKRDAPEAADAMPRVLPDGMPTDVTVADPLERLATAANLEATTAVSLSAAQPLLIDQLHEDGPLEDKVVELEAVPPITYVPPTGVSLAPVSGAMAVTCHRNLLLERCATDADPSSDAILPVQAQDSASAEGRRYST